MRSYCAVYVDVGYLLASAATRVTGSSLRSGIEVDYPGLIAGLVAQVEADSGLPLLRVNWYDSGARSGGQPDYHQDQIGLLPRIKLRLGRLSYAGEQKGVDVRLGLDMALQGRARVADVVYLVSGDDDLTEAVEEAQSAGVQVVLLSVPGLSGHGHAVSKHLRRAADGEQPIDPEIIDRCVRSRAIPEGLIPVEPAEHAEHTEHTESTEPSESIPSTGVPASEHVVAPVGDSPDASSEGGTSTPTPSQPSAPGPEPKPAAAQPAAASSPAVPTPSAPPTPAVFGRKRATEVVLPAAQTAPTWSTTTGDRPVVDADGVFNPELIDAVAKTVLDSWCRTATPDDLVALRAAKPAIPGDLDRALLLDLSGRAGVYDIDDTSRHEVRERFWFHVARVRLA
ncbi:NYN domain-containing protein [Knoellia sp. CPCC 206453]|uniref:NYN domain-containing protein n=1 Tax=Knoellia pratensis TaxID=3404796 RepID=UPI00361ED724